MVRQHKRLRLSFLTAFTSRNDMVVIGLFLMTWFIYFSDLIQGVDHIDAASYAGTVIGLLGGIVLVSVPIWGWLIERIGEVTSLAVALLFTGIGFASLGLIVNPFSNWIFLPVLLIGIGQAGCLLVPQTLALDLAPEEIRGSILGVFNTIGCLGVIFFLQIGGILFDWISPTAPFVLAGIANLLIFGYALLVMRGPDEVQETA
jgi:DHA1 family tetracycline resistance protein-like MFS transporter